MPEAITFLILVVILTAMLLPPEMTDEELRESDCMRRE